MIGAFGPLLRKVSGAPLGEKTFKVDVPEGLLLDDKGESVRTAEAAPSDILALALSLAIATAEVSSNHTNFTLNNLVACLIATVRITLTSRVALETNLCSICSNLSWPYDLDLMFSYCRMSCS